MKIEQLLESQILEADSSRYNRLIEGRLKQMSEEQINEIDWGAVGGALKKGASNVAKGVGTVARGVGAAGGAVAGAWDAAKQGYQAGKAAVAGGGVGAPKQSGVQGGADAVQQAGGQAVQNTSDVAPGKTVGSANANQQTSQDKMNTKKVMDLISTMTAGQKKAIYNQLGKVMTQKAPAAPAEQPADQQAQAADMGFGFNGQSGQPFQSQQERDAYFQERGRPDPRAAKTAPAQQTPTSEPQAQAAAPAAQPNLQVQQGGKAPAQAAPATAPSTRKQGGGKVAGQLSQSPGAIRKREQRAIKADQARLATGTNESFQFESKFLGRMI